MSELRRIRFALGAELQALIDGDTSDPEFMARRIDGIGAVLRRLADVDPLPQEPPKRPRRKLGDMPDPPLTGRSW